MTIGGKANENDRRDDTDIDTDIDPDINTDIDPDIDTDIHTDIDADTDIDIDPTSNRHRHRSRRLSCTRIASAWGSVESPKATGIASSGIAKIATRNYKRACQDREKDAAVIETQGANQAQ